MRKKAECGFLLTKVETVLMDKNNTTCHSSRSDFANKSEDFQIHRVGIIIIPKCSGFIFEIKELTYLQKQESTIFSFLYETESARTTFTYRGWKQLSDIQLADMQPVCFLNNWPETLNVFL
ncbi:hypothetical protein WUBG_06853 [Wuchereria bancrofti]|uniref:Uncharacterized protein n=1 Tax=Wuchereria bancrofti TaxID=6293 RepID=J9EJ79_WUCBA|nr:hypothetical protein WUBG_06853 [Wuchereria bancrofti]